VPIPDRLAISAEELAGYQPGRTLAEQARALLFQQRDSWDLARQGYAGLGRVELRSLVLDGYPFTLQHNPGRITSSTASVDDASIRNRRCFLCLDNLPEGQKAILLEDRWLLLVNPFPIFPEHFTVANLGHIPQRITGNVRAMLRMVRDLGPGYTLFYNGPRSGASAPDHMHFQVGSRDFMPIDHEAPALIARHGEELNRDRQLRLLAVSGLLRPFFALESDQARPLEEAIDRVISALPHTEASTEEPMVNVIARWEGLWRVLIYPRARHRPSFFFEEGPQKILISPAAVDMGGVSIVPRREDFDKVSPQDLERMFSEVCLDPRAFSTVVNEVQKRLTSG
jgi:hypothetical protein